MGSLTGFLTEGSLRKSASLGSVFRMLVIVFRSFSTASRAF
jgi:hypothetical protein